MAGSFRLRVFHRLWELLPGSFRFGALGSELSFGSCFRRFWEPLGAFAEEFFIGVGGYWLGVFSLGAFVDFGSFGLGAFVCDFFVIKFWGLLAGSFRLGAFRRSRGLAGSFRSGAFRRFWVHLAETFRLEVFKHLYMYGISMVLVLYGICMHGIWLINAKEYDKIMNPIKMTKPK